MASVNGLSGRPLQPHFGLRHMIRCTVPPSTVSWSLGGITFISTPYRSMAAIRSSVGCRNFGNGLTLPPASCTRGASSLPENSTP